MSLSKSLVRSALAILAGISLAGSAMADTIYWTDATGNGRWSSAANWNPSRVPGSSDDVVCNLAPGGEIRVTGLALCRTLQSTRLVTLVGGSADFHAFVSAVFSGGILMYTQFPFETPYLHNHGEITIAGVSNIFDGFIFSEDGKHTIFAPGSTTTFWQGINPEISGLQNCQINGGVIENHGHIEVKASVLTLGSLNPLYPRTSFINHPDGEMRFTAGGTIADETNPTFQGGYSSFQNFGFLGFSGGGVPQIERDVEFLNIGTLSIDGTALNINTIASIVDSELMEGTWLVSNAGLLESNGANATSIGPNAVVMMDGLGAYAPAFSQLVRNRGVLAVDHGAQCILYQEAIGMMLNEGTLFAGPGSQIRVYGGITNTSAGTVRAVVAGPTASDRGWIEAYNAVNLAGHLVVDFYDTDLIHPGAQYPVIGFSATGCCELGGTFDDVAVYPPQDLTPGAAYTQTYAAVTFTPACPGDASGDGAVGLADVAEIIVHWSEAVGAAPAAADQDGSGSIGLGDVAVVISNWGVICD